MYLSIAVLVAIIYWFFDSSIHYFIYQEPKFELIPHEINELWMRITIILLILAFGIFADYSSNKILTKEKQLEAINIYNSMLKANQHILNNLLNQMILFKIEAENCQDFNPEILTLMDISLDEASELFKNLSEVEHITDTNIWASINPAEIRKNNKVFHH